MDLIDPRWQQLKANYTNGAHVAELLSLARSDTPIHRWYDDLFQELCHQYTVSEAAYAALPHLVSIAREKPDARMELLILAAACYTFSPWQDSTPVPSEFAEAWHAAARDAIPLLIPLLEERDHSESNLRYLLFALASFQGHHPLAIAIEALDTVVECPNCGHLIDRMETGL